MIILDEPTSALDAAAEFAFFEHFREMAKGRSALIISHRFSTVRLADRVYVLDGGRIVEQGTHDFSWPGRALCQSLPKAVVVLREHADISQRSLGARHRRPRDAGCMKTYGFLSNDLAKSLARRIGAYEEV